MHLLKQWDISGIKHHVQMCIIYYNIILEE